MFQIYLLGKHEYESEMNLKYTTDLPKECMHYRTPYVIEAAVTLNELICKDLCNEGWA